MCAREGEANQIHITLVHQVTIHIAVLFIVGFRTLKKKTTLCTLNNRNCKTYESVLGSGSLKLIKSFKILNLFFNEHIKEVFPKAKIAP